MKNNFIRIILIALGLFIALLLIFQSCKIKKLEKQNQLQAVEIMSAKDSVTALRTKKGEMYFDMIAATVDAKFLKSALEKSGFENKDLKERGIALNTIISTLKTQLSFSGHDTIVLKDTIIHLPDVPPTLSQKFNWTNNYLTISGLILNKKMELDYWYKSDLTLITSRKKNQTIVTGYLTDPNARIITGSSIVVTHPKRWYEKQWLWGAVGAGIGFYLAK
jgi:hypothetical protein